jgi:hypothetical protein
MERVREGVPVKDIAGLDVVSEIVRLKSEIPNQELARIDEYVKRMEQGLSALKSPSQEV